MMKERMAAIIIGGLMLLSMAGFAVMGLGRFSSGNQQSEIPTVINNTMSGEQISGILQTGRIVIRDVYEEGCMLCMSRDAELEIFANTFKGYAVLEKAAVNPENYTIDEQGYAKFEMISPRGDIVDLKDREINQESLTDIFCEISVIQPRECLLREVTASKPLPADNTTSNQSAADNSTNSTDD